MISSFHEWAKIKEQQRLDEVSTTAEARPNPYLHMNQNEGDWVFFGVNQLFKMFKEQGHVPKNLDMSTIVPFMGRIVSPDDPGKSSVKGLVKVALAQPLHKLGYRSLKSQIDRSGQHFINIKIEDLNDFTSILGTGAVLSGDKLWLAAVNPSQRKKMEAIKRVEERNATERNSGPTMTPDISDKDVDAARNWLQGVDQTQDVGFEPMAKPSLDDLVGSSPEEEPNLPTPMQKYRMTQGRQVTPWDTQEPIKTNPSQLRGVRQARQPRVNDPEALSLRKGIFGASVDPDIAYGMWKIYNDAKEYKYYPTSQA